MTHGARSVRSVAIACALVTASFAIPRTAAAAPVASVVRLAGTDCYGTSVAVSRHGWNTSTYVVVVTGQGFTDALAAAPLARAYNAPVLLTTKSSIPAVVVAEIKRLKARRAIVIGSTSSVGSAVISKLKSLVGKSRVERISGSDRYDTAAKIATRLKSKHVYGGQIAVANGTSFADAFAVAGFAAQKHYPILLVKSGSVPLATKKVIAQLRPRASIVVGRTSAVSDAVLRSLPHATRIAGTDDFGTAWAVAEYAAARGSSFAQVVIASNYGYKDVLGAGALTARIGGVYLLTPPNSLCGAARQALIGHLAQIASVHILGNESSFHPPTQAAIEALLANVNAVPWSSKRLLSAGSGNYYVRDLDSKASPDGGLVVIWFTGDDLFLRKLDAKGNTVISTLVVPMSPHQLGGYGESYPRVAVGPDGRITVIWRYSTGSATLDGTWAVQYDSAGRFIRGPWQLGFVAPRFLDVATDSSGNLHITGRDALSRPTFTCLTADLQVLVPWTPLTAMSRAYFTRLEAIGVHPNGTDDVVWLDSRDFPTFGNYELYHSRLAWAPAIPRVSASSIDQAKLTSVTGGFYESEAGGSNFSGNSWQPGTSVGDDGSTHVGWISDGSSVWYQRLDSAGNPAFAARKIADVGHATDFTPQVDVAARADGGADYVYTYYDTGLASQRLAHVVLDSDGTSLTPAGCIGALTARPWYFSLQRNGGNLQLEYSEANGSFQRVYYADTLRDAASFDTSRCDLVVDDAHSSNSTWPKEGQVVTMTVQVANHGWVGSPASAATFSYLGSSFATIPVPPLAVDATAAISATWTVPANFTDATATMTVSVDPTHTIAECSKTNNTAEHPVPVHLRPSDVNLVFLGMDETLDPTHALGCWQTDHIHVALSGTRSEPPGGSVAMSAVVSGTADMGVLRHVPPGTYQLSYDCTGYAAPYSPISVQVSRDATDPYKLTATPNDGFVECWVNTWGTLGGQVFDDHGTPGTGDDTGLGGVKITIAETGDTTTTATNGTFAIPHVAAGTYHVNADKDGFRRTRLATATVTVGGNPNLQILTGATTKAYVDAVVLGTDDSPLPGASAEIHSAGGTLLQSAATDDRGNAAFEVDAGTAIYVRGTAPYFVAANGSQFTPVAGRSYAQEVQLDIDTSLLSRTSSDWSSWSVYTDYFRIEHAESTTSYRNFQTHFNVDWIDDAGTRRVKAVHAWAHGLAFMTDQLVVPLEWEVLGYPIKITDADPLLASKDPSNVWIKHVKLIDSSDGTVLYDSGEISPAVQTGAYADAMNGAHLTMDVPVPWSDLEVWTWYTVEKVGPAGEWEPSPLGGYGSNSMIVVYTPATGVQRPEMGLFSP